MIRAPEPGGTSGDVANILTSIRCTRPANCWTVGVVEMSLGAADQILRWNGTTWRTALGPALAPGPGGQPRHRHSRRIGTQAGG